MCTEEKVDDNGDGAKKGTMNEGEGEPYEGTTEDDDDDDDDDDDVVVV